MKLMKLKSSHHLDNNMMTTINISRQLIAIEFLIRDRKMVGTKIILYQKKVSQLSPGPDNVITMRRQKIIKAVDL